MLYNNKIIKIARLGLYNKLVFKHFLYDEHNNNTYV